MFDRAKYKEDAKRELYAHHNRSGMVGAQVLYSFVSTGVLAIFVSTVTALSVAAGVIVASMMVMAGFSGAFLVAIPFLYLLYGFILWVICAIAFMASDPVRVGLARYYLHTHKYGIRPRVLAILDGFDYFWDISKLSVAALFYITRWPWLLLICGCEVGLIMGEVAAVTYSHTGLFLALLLIVIVTIAAIIWQYYMQLRVWPYVMVVADHPQIEAKEMIERCKHMTEGHVLDLLVFELSYIGWNLLSWVTGGIAGLVYVKPYYNLARANVYAALKGSPIVLDKLGDPVGRGGGTISIGRTPLPGPAPAPAPALTAPALFGMVGSYKGYIFPLEPNETVVIGRDAASASIVLTLNTEKISRRHCAVRYNGQMTQYEVTDFSTNGVFVNGSRIEANKPVCLPRGTVIFLGSDANGFKLV